MIYPFYVKMVSCHNQSVFITLYSSEEINIIRTY